MKQSPYRLLPWIYPVSVVVVLILWLTYMTVFGRFSLFRLYWPMPLTMVFGSLVAGATPLGGSAVSFPVFTKLLQIPASDSRTFGLMIQSVGMTMAAFFIIGRGIRVLHRVIVSAVLGGAVGIVVGTYFLVIPPPYPRILFTLSTAAFAVALIITRWVLKWEPRQKLPPWSWQLQLLLGGSGFFGGVFAANTGGADIFTFIVLTLAFGIHEKINIPTTVMITAVNSLMGFFWHGAVSQDIGIVWNYWLVCIPVVIIGAPLGAFFNSRVRRETILSGILGLIALELASTLFFIPFTTSMTVTALIFVALCALFFWGLLRYQSHSQQNSHTEVLPV